WLNLYDDLRKQGQLTLRFYIAYFLDPPELTPATVETIEQARRTYHDDWIAGGAVKMMLDGVVESKTADMLKPYSDDPSLVGKLGVIASMQPLHSYPNEDTLDVWARNAGPDRASRGWVWHSIAAHGGRLAFGSDWPVVTLNPWDGVQNALTRQTTEGKPVGG